MYSESHRRAIWGSAINRPSLIVRPSTKMRAVAASAVTVKPVSAYGPVCVYMVYYTNRLRLRRHRFRV